MNTDLTRPRKKGGYTSCMEKLWVRAIALCNPSTSIYTTVCNIGTASIVEGGRLQYDGAEEEPTHYCGND